MITGAGSNYAILIIPAYLLGVKWSLEEISQCLVEQEVANLTHLGKKWMNPSFRKIIIVQSIL